MCVEPMCVEQFDDIFVFSGKQSFGRLQAAGRFERT